MVKRYMIDKTTLEEDANETNTISEALPEDLKQHLVYKDVSTKTT